MTAEDEAASLHHGECRAWPRRPRDIGRPGIDEDNLDEDNTDDEIGKVEGDDLDDRGERVWQAHASAPSGAGGTPLSTAISI